MWTVVFWVVTATRLHSISTQNTTIHIFTAVETSSSYEWQYFHYQIRNSILGLNLQTVISFGSGKNHHDWLSLVLCLSSGYIALSGRETVNDVEMKWSWSALWYYASIYPELKNTTKTVSWCNWSLTSEPGTHWIQSKAHQELASVLDIYYFSALKTEGYERCC
jgi:hypothetical protein